MGKVGKLIIAAVGVGLAAIPGAQGFAAGLLSGVGVGGGVTTFGFYAAQALRTVGVLSALSTVAGLFSPSAPKPQVAISQRREPIPVRTYLAGRRRPYGVINLCQ